MAIYEPIAISVGCRYIALLTFLHFALNAFLELQYLILFFLTFHMREV